MKKILLLIGLSLMSSGIFAQTSSVDEEPLDFRHELKLNLFSTIIGLCPEISYEHMLNTNMGLGARASFALSDNWYGGSYHFLATPYFRWYFPFLLRIFSSADHRMSGYFVEVNVGAGNRRDKTNDSLSDYPSSDTHRESGSTLLGMGVGTGYRLVMARGWSFEFLGMIGRDLLNLDGYGFYGSTGITIGYTF